LSIRTPICFTTCGRSRQFCKERGEVAKKAREKEKKKNEGGDCRIVRQPEEVLGERDDSAGERLGRPERKDRVGRWDYINRLYVKVKGRILPAIREGGT